MTVPRLNQQPNKLRGFTLIEVMLVVLVIGVMVSFVQLAFPGNKLARDLEQVTQRFAGQFVVASEYGMLNNLELGLLIDEQSYEFLGYDGVRWTPIEDSDLFANQTLPAHIKMTLVLEGLAIDEKALLDIEALREAEEGLFTQQDEDDEKKTRLPQIYLFSGGEITPFQLTFSAIDSLDFDEDITFEITGDYALPLTIEGPIAP